MAAISTISMFSIIFLRETSFLNKRSWQTLFHIFGTSYSFFYVFFLEKEGDIEIHG
jgi:hypothetical protein